MSAAPWLLVALAACGLRSPAPVLKQYRLEYPSPTVAAPALPVVLRVDAFGVNAAYNRDGIAWREGPYEVGTSPTHRWTTTPPRMITDLLARDLAASGRYAAVVQGVSPLSAAYALGGEVERLEAEVGAKGCTARLDVRVLLARTGGDALLQRRYAVDEPCRTSDPDGLVAAMSEGLRKVSGEVQQDVYAAVARDLASAPEPAPAVAKDEALAPR